MTIADKLKQCLRHNKTGTANNIIFLAFPAHIVIAHTPAVKANLQAGATQPCPPAIRNHLICAKSK